MSGGTLGNQSEAAAGSIFNFSGGEIGSSFVADAGSVVNISGGIFEEEFEAIGNVNISGGGFGDDFTATFGSVVNISGGTFGDEIEFRSGSEVNLFGSNFLLDGVLLDDTLQLGDSFLVESGDSLSGIFVDGSEFSFDLTSSSGALSVTLTAVPEPSSVSLLFLAGAAMLARRRRG